MSWIGPTYADMGWIKLTEAEKKELKLKQVVSKINAEKKLADKAISDVKITVEKKTEWVNYLLALDLVLLQPDVTGNTYYPIRPII